MLDPVRRLSVPPLAVLEGQGHRSVGCGGAAGGIPHPFPLSSSTICGTHPYAFVQPLVHQGGCTRGGHPGFNCQGCGGACSTSLSRLLQPSVRGLENLGVVASSHRSLDPQSLRGCVTLPDGDHSVSPSFRPSGRLDGLHRSSGSLLAGFGTSGIASLPPLCGPWPSISVQSVVFRPIHGPKVFTRVMAPVFVILHSLGICMRRYLDDWLVQSSSRESLLQDLQVVLDLCRELGIVVNPEKSNLVPSQVVLYLGVVLNTRSFLASPSPDRVSRLLSTAGEFLSSASPPASVWLSLLGMLSSMAHLVPGGRLRMRSLQLCLHWSWDRGDQSTPVAWSPDCLRDLQWWLHLPRLSQGVSLSQVSPDLDFWSDASDVGWGAHLGSLVASGLWDELESRLPINARELLAVRRGLLHFQSSLLGKTVAVFCDNVTAVAYLRKEGGTRSPFLNSLAQVILHWSESLHVRLSPQFIPGSRNVLADALSRPHQLPSSEWSLNLEVFLSLRRRWPVQIALFATSENRRCSIYFSPIRDPQSAGTDGLQVYAFPPWSIIPRVLAKLRVSRGTELTLVAPYWPQRPWFLDLLQLSLAPPVVLPNRPDLLLQHRSRLRYRGLHKLRLHAWRLFGVSPERPVSRPL